MGIPNSKTEMEIPISKLGSPRMGSMIRNGDHHSEMVIFVSPFWTGAGSVTNPF
jgi:hypothetical protein